MDHQSVREFASSLGSNFPNEVWCIILNNMDYYSIRFASVSKSFYQLVFQSVTDLSAFVGHLKNPNTFPNFKEFNDEYIERFPNLQKLDVIASYPSTFTNAGIKKLKNLTSLHLVYNFNINDEGIKELSNLTSLNLNNHLITNEGIKNLFSLKHLAIISNKKITDECIRGLSNITSLNLTSNILITDEGIKELLHLTSLNISGTNLIME
jgi:hypothetical protein